MQSSCNKTPVLCIQFTLQTCSMNCIHVCSVLFTMKVNLTTLLYWDSSVSNSATLFWAFSRSRLSDSKSSVQICIWALSALIVSASLSSWPICPHCTSNCNCVSSPDLLINCWFLSSSSSCNCKQKYSLWCNYNNSKQLFLKLLGHLLSNVVWN